MASPMAADRDDGDAGQRATRWVGRSVPRVEDAALLTGRGRYIDDLGVRPGTLQAAILRSPHAHAEIEAIDCQAARAADGVFAVLTGADIVALTSSLVVGIKAPIDCWPIATDRVRYVGEPVAVVVASDRYRAEDALDLIEVSYRPLPAVVDPLTAATPDAPLLHPRAQSNVVGERVFRYGDPSARSPLPRIASASMCAIRAIPARRSRPMASSPNTTRRRTPTTSSPTSRGRSACTR